MSDEAKSEKKENKHYLERILNLLPKNIPWPLRALILVSIWLLISGFGLILDSINGTFPNNLYLLRGLYAFNWFMCCLFFIISVYLSKKFCTKVMSWIDTRDFSVDFDARNKLKHTVNKVLTFGFGPIPMLAAIGIYILRRFLILLMPNIPIEVSIKAGIYEYWYLGSDILGTFLALILFWSIILFSGIVRHVASAHPVRVRDLAEYKDNFEDIVRLANRNILFVGVALGVYLLGVFYWALSAGTTEYFIATIFLLSISLAGVTLICWLNLSGIQRGLEKAKKTRIGDIRSTASLSPELKDLQISLHSQVTIWNVGPKFVESFLLPLLVAEIPILLQNMGTLLKLLGVP